MLLPQQGKREVPDEFEEEEYRADADEQHNSEDEPNSAHRNREDEPAASWSLLPKPLKCLRGGRCRSLLEQLVDAFLLDGALPVLRNAIGRVEVRQSDDPNRFELV